MDREQGEGKGMTALIKCKSEMNNIVRDNVKRFDVVQKGGGEFWFLYLEVEDNEKLYIALDDILRFTIVER